MSTTSCTVSISVLQAAPYNLGGGASIYAKVLAVNFVGSSALSLAGNGAVLPTIPDAPVSLAKDAAITNA